MASRSIEVCLQGRTTRSVHDQHCWRSLLTGGAARPANGGYPLEASWGRRRAARPTPVRPAGRGGVPVARREGQVSRLASPSAPDAFFSQVPATLLMVREGSSEPTVAILMDYENARDVNLNRVLAEAAAFGRVIVRRAYADWTRHAKAQSALREAGFEELHQFTTGSGTKNATDIMLTVDAMDLLYTRPIDTFILVTADSDFAKLARRLREGGKRVVGLGSRKRVGRALVQSCDQFIYYDQAPAAPIVAALPEAAYAEEARRAAASPAKHAAPAGKTKLSEGHRIVLEAMPAAADDEGRVYGGPLHES